MREGLQVCVDEVEMLSCSLAWVERRMLLEKEMNTFDHFFGVRHLA